MRATFALACAVALGSLPAFGHGPQLQITRDGDKITTRRILREEPYSNRLTPLTTVYVIPLMETQNVWYSRPNNSPSATVPGLPEYLSGPGIAYGYDQVDGGPRAFASGQRFELNLIDGLLWWDGSGFIDPVAEEIEVFRSSGAPAVTNDSLTAANPATLAFGNVSATYDATAHSGASFRLLGDGVNPTVEGDNGIYLLTMTYGSSDPALNDSDPFYFVLHKKAAFADISAAVSSLGASAASVQYVPEPATAALFVLGLGGLALSSRRTRR